MMDCLKVCEFLSNEDARSKIDQWRNDYDHRCPHSSLGHLTPSQYVQ
jgi:putative transposase